MPPTPPPPRPAPTVAIPARAAGPRFASLEGLRALAALAVFFTHVYPYGYAGEVWWGIYFSQLNVGVSIFFVISGFVMYRPFAAAHLATGEGIGTRQYLVRRALRIYPAYWVVLVVAVATGFASLPTLFAWITNWFLVGPYFLSTMPSIVGIGMVHAWTLGVEVSFYVFLPVFAWGVRRLGQRTGRLRAQWIGVAGVLALGTIGYTQEVWGAWWVHDFDGDRFQPLGVLLPWLGLFGCGMVLALVSVRVIEGGRRIGWVEWSGRHPAAWWAVALGAYLLVCNGIGLETGSAGWSTGTQVARQALHALIGSALVISAVFGDPATSRVRRALASPLAVALGTVSYGIYLWHYPIIEEVAESLFPDRTAPFTLLRLTAVALPLTLLAAWLSYRFVEAPCMRVGLRLRARRGARPGGG